MAATSLQTARPCSLEDGKTRWKTTILSASLRSLVAIELRLARWLIIFLGVDVPIVLGNEAGRVAVEVLVAVIPEERLSRRIGRGCETANKDTRRQHHRGISRVHAHKHASIQTAEERIPGVVLAAEALQETLRGAERGGHRREPASGLENSGGDVPQALYRVQVLQTNEYNGSARAMQPTHVRMCPLVSPPLNAADFGRSVLTGTIDLRRFSSILTVDWSGVAAQAT
eukprot:scaffold438_cov250-Pinguiococcus_pyrenoidosus.AAC.43